MDKNLEFKSINDVEGFIERLSQKVLFRGHSDINRELIPSVGRNNKHIDERIELGKFKKQIFENFSAISDRHLNKEYFKEFCTDFSLLALAQHYEVFPTRFLDWTQNISIALFFACNDLSRDGCVWYFILPGNTNPCWIKPGREKRDDSLFYQKLKIYFFPRFIDELRFEIENKNPP